MFVAEMGVALVVLFNKWNTKRKLRSSQYEQLPDETDEAPASVNAEASGGSVATRVEGLTGKRILLLGLPSTCDIIGTTFMNVGLLVVPVSIFQMVRGAVVLFVGSFSVIFLKRTLSRKQWAGLLSVTVGVFIVGLSAIGHNKKSDEPTTTAWETAFGVLIILLAQVFTASQFVLEEFILEKYSMEPIKVVAWEGTFGTLITVVASLLVYAIFVPKSSDTHSIFDLTEGVSQVVSNRALLTSSFLIMLALSTFNVTGLTVTRLISATSRSTIDTCRTIGIWAVSLLIGWETFKFLQLVGFAMLVFGTLLFNGVILADDETKKNSEALLPQEFEHT